MPLIVVTSPVFAGSLGLLPASATPVDVPQAVAIDLVGRRAAVWVTTPVPDNAAGLLTRAEAVDVKALALGTGSLLPRYRAALAATAAGTADTIIAYLGDSTVAGAHATGVDWPNNRPFAPPVVLGNWLAANLGLPVSQDAFFGQGSAGASLTYDPRVTRSNWTGLSDGNPGSVGGGTYRNDTNEAASINFRCSEPFDTIRVFYLTNTGGANFTISINGGAALGATVSSTGGLLVTSTTRTCARGIHTVNLNRQAGAGFMCIYGVEVSDSTTRRVKVWNWGAGGTSIGPWVTTATVLDLGSVVQLAPPHLMLVQLGVNDYIAGRTNAQAVADYQAFVDLHRPTSDIVFITPSPSSAGSASLANQRAVVTACRQVAQQNGCPLIDQSALYGSYLAGVAQGNYLPGNEAVHPGAAGYAKTVSLVQTLPGLLR